MIRVPVRVTGHKQVECFAATSETFKGAFRRVYYTFLEPRCQPLYFRHTRTDTRVCPEYTYIYLGIYPEYIDYRSGYVPSIYPGIFLSMYPGIYPGMPGVHNRVYVLIAYIPR